MPQLTVQQRALVVKMRFQGKSQTTIRSHQFYQTPQEATEYGESASPDQSRGFCVPKVLCSRPHRMFAEDYGRYCGEERR